MNSVTLDRTLDHPFLATDLPIPGKRTGKVRDIYPLSDERLLLVTTDRLSAFDHVLGSAPYKGQVLNQLSAFWFERTKGIVSNHLIQIPDPNAMVVQAVEMLPVEVVVRGYISGVTKTALWYRYELGERVIYGHGLPDGLRKNQALPEPLITPTTKGGPGKHDERLTCDEVVEKGYLAREIWEVVQRAALEIFRVGQRVALGVGLILVDTKYEFGLDSKGKVLLIDEVHTPDSSRFWLADSYMERLEAGLEPENYDKEFVRLEYAARGYRGDGEPPKMDPDFWLKVSDRYIQLFEKLTGTSFRPGEYPVEPRLLSNLRQEDLLT
jgi:phosphoribosylaminoimidazole-succinocarboxamide synthase